jgi:hypothetical protein
MRFIRLLGLLAATHMLPACIHAQGRLESNRFQHRAYPYAVFYADGGRPDAPLGPGWKVENFRFPDKKHMYPLAGMGFTTLRGFDANRDGKLDNRREELFYDLLLSHKGPAGAMWVRSVPLAHADAALAPSELAQRYVSAAVEQGRVAASFGMELAALPARSGAGHGSSCELSKRSAYRIDFELPAGKVGSTRHAARDGSVVVVQTPYRADAGHPVVLLIGRSSAPEHATALEHDFEKLLAATVLGDLHAGLSMKGGHTCARSAAPTAAQSNGATPAEAESPADDVLELAPSEAFEGEAAQSSPADVPESVGADDAPAAGEAFQPVEEPTSGGEI